MIYFLPLVAIIFFISISKRLTLKFKIYSILVLIILFMLLLAFVFYFSFDKAIEDKIIERHN